MASFNEAYQLLFEAEQHSPRKDNLDGKIRGLEDIVFLAKQTAQAEWDTRVAEEQQKQQSAKRGRGKSRKPPELPSEFYDGLRDELFAKHKIRELDERLKAVRSARKALLLDLADDVVLKSDPNCWYRVETSSSSSYSSQGWGSGKYGEGQLFPLFDKLQEFGFEAHVRSVHATYGVNYELWANCPPWMADAVDKRITIEDAVRSWKSRAINPRVYYPFLSYELDGLIPWGPAAVKKPQKQETAC